MAHRDANGEGLFDDNGEKRLAVVLGDLLGVVDAHEPRFPGEHHGRSDDGPGKSTAPRLVNTGQAIARPTEYLHVKRLQTLIHALQFLTIRPLTLWAWAFSFL